MNKIDLVRNDLSNLLLDLEDCIANFYDLNYLDDEDMLEVLGLQFTYRSLSKYVKNIRKENEDGKSKENV